jgi:hypothetical protein
VALCFNNIFYQNGNKKAENLSSKWFSAFYKQIAGIEPVSPAWEASVLPMNYICMRLLYQKFLISQAPITKGEPVSRRILAKL